MSDDIEVLEAQAERLAAVWTGILMDHGVVVVLLTDPAPHEDALRALLQHPEQVRFQSSTHTRLELDEVHRQVAELTDRDSRRSLAPGLERVLLALRAGEGTLAGHLAQRFGDALEITLGRHRYPLDPSRVLTPPPVPVATIELPTLTATVELDQRSWKPGEDVTGRVHLRNRGTANMSVIGGFHAVGLLLDDDGRPVGQAGGWMALVRKVTTITPGGQAEVRFIAGSETSDPRLGAALPPGTYRLVIPLAVSAHPEAQHAGLAERGSTFLTDPIPIQLTYENP